MDSVLHDLRYALRQAIKNPGSTLVAVISLALGIGATTAVFSVIYAALINPYPYPGADRIVRLTVQSKAGSGDWVELNGPQVQQIRQLNIVENLLAMDYHALTLTGRELPENVNAVGLISDGFETLGVPTLLGRGLLPADAIDGQDPQPVTVVSYKFWQSHYFSSPDVLGKTLQLDHQNYQIVGVAAPRFTWYSADVYLPLKITQDPNLTFIINLRLRKGATNAQADTALQPLLDQFARDMPKRFPEHFKVDVEGLNKWVVESISGTLYLLFGAVALLLAIGCGNVSILLLARGTARRHELAVRSAIGAGRRRIVRQLLTESLLLAVIGASLGVLASCGFLVGIKSLLPRYAFAPEVVIGINLPVLIFSVVVALATGVLFGLWPALQLSRSQIGQIMQSNVRRVAGSIRAHRTQSVLIAGQIALTLLLLSGAGSAMRSFTRLINTTLGYDPHNVMSVGIPLHGNSYTTWAARGAYFEQLRTKVAGTPGVTVAAISSNATPPRNGLRLRFEILGKPAIEEQTGAINMVSPSYFAALRIPIVQGQAWSDTQNQNGARVAVVNRMFALRYFPSGDVIGHSVKVPGIEDRPPEILSAPNVADSWLQIVGVAEDVHNDGLRNPVKPAVYVPYTLCMRQGTQILVRSEVSPLSLLHSVQKQLTAANPEQQTYETTGDLETWISEEPEWQQQHLATWIFGIFAWLALALGAVGLYSVVAYTVAQRTNEFGIRMALGAQPGHVIRVVFASTLASVGGGVLGGLGLALFMNSLIGKWVEGNLRDPLILLAGVVLLGVVSAIACAIPARHAAKVDPMTALRCE